MKRIPEIRLKGFEGEWKPSTIGDISDSFSGGTPSARESAYYGGTIPFIRSGEISSDRTELFLTESGLQNSSAKIVNKGTLLYALYGATSGEVAISKIKGAINQAILAILPHKGYDTSFLNFWLRSNKENITSTLLQGGQGNLSGELVKRISIHFPPSNKEQQSIGSFFYSYDHLISEHQQRLENLRRVKKSMLQKMFPQQGQTVPEIRFKGFEGEWKRKRLGDVLEVGNGCDYKHLNEGNVPVYGTGGIITFVDDYLYDGETVCIGRKGTIDLPIYHKGKIWTVDTLFYTYNIDCNVRFLYYLFCTIDWKMYNEATGVPSLSKENIKKIASCFPENDEQCQIASFFTSLDNLITQEVKYIDQLNRVKHTLLQKMFV